MADQGSLAGKGQAQDFRQKGRMCMKGAGGGGRWGGWKGKKEGKEQAMGDATFLYPAKAAAGPRARLA